MTAPSVASGLLALLCRQLDVEGCLYAAADSPQHHDLSDARVRLAVRRDGSVDDDLFDAPVHLTTATHETSVAIAPGGWLVLMSDHALRPLSERESILVTDVAELLEQTLAAETTPAAPVNDLTRLAATIEAKQGLEPLTRPLLTALQEMTNLASTYLTTIDEAEGFQHILLSNNTRADFEMPEGLTVPWGDTLCKRARDEGRPVNTEVPATWGDSQAAADLGIQVYVSVPVQLSDGSLWGTLCAADSRKSDDVGAHLATMRLFSKLIAHEIERSQAIAESAAHAADALELAKTDRLTNTSVRHVIEPWIANALSSLKPHEALVVSFFDLNDFKVINDSHGHAAGDAVLVAVADQLRHIVRPTDLLGRYGGDEFVVAAQMPETSVDAYRTRIDSVTSMPAVIGDGPVEINVSVGTAVAHGSRPVADANAAAHALVAEADEAMYAHKATAKSPAR